MRAVPIIVVRIIMIVVIEGAECWAVVEVASLDRRQINKAFGANVYGISREAIGGALNTRAAADIARHNKGSALTAGSDIQTGQAGLGVESQ